MTKLDLQINISQSKDCKNFYFFDVTTLYNSLSAPFGYDLHNLGGGDTFKPSQIDLTLSYLEILLPNGVTKDINFVSGDMSTTRLDSDGKNLIQKTISYTDLGLSSGLLDGVYKFTYHIMNDDGSLHFVSSCYIVNDCGICCCLDKKLLAISQCSDCKDKDIRSVYDLYLKRDAARMQAACGNYTSANNTIQYLTDACGIKKCDSCN